MTRSRSWTKRSGWCRKLLERIDIEHIRPILAHLNEQDHQIEEITGRILEEIRKSHGTANG